MTAAPRSRLDALLPNLARTDPRTVVTADERLHTHRAGNAQLLALAGPARRSVAIRLCWDGGPAAEDPATAGHHAVTVQALARSCGPGGTVPLAERLESMGIAVTAGVTECSSYLDLRGPREYIHPALRLASAAVAAGAVDQVAFEAARSTTLYSVDRRTHSLATLAGDTFRAARADPASVLARPAEGTAQSLRTMSAADARALAGRLAGGCDFRVIIAGDPAAHAYADDVAPLTEQIGATNGHRRPARGGAGQAARSALADDPPEQVRQPSGLPSQAYLLWGTAVQTASQADHIVLELAVHMLGGWSGSRWNSLFREQLGYTYSTRSSITSLAFGGRTYCLAQVGMAVAPATLTQARDLLMAQAAAFLSDPPPAAEILAACVQLLRTEAHFHDYTRHLMDRAGSFLQAGLEPAFAERRIDALRAVEPDRFGDRLKALMSSTTLVILTDSRE